MQSDATNMTQAERDAAASAKIGYCTLECDNFVWYIILFSIFVFIHSTSEVGSMLLILRCVDPRDKAMALGLIQFAIGLFGMYHKILFFGRLHVFQLILELLFQEKKI